ncbi:DsrH/TusB family sulfur metabolism protein [Pseudoalteromonas agarivorans]|uniref:DsrH/TusB family sulfur metabolism protein n=1 Tax=Pseudoalteromonas agarivorans TaxID=176102 RepID=UPI00311DEFF5
MSTLHIFSKTLNNYCASQLGNLIRPTDKVLLLGDACFSKKQFKQFSGSLLLLAQDITVRAITLSDNDTAISYEEFVALTLSTNQSITW